MLDGLQVHLNDFDAPDESVRRIVIDYEHDARDLRQTAKDFRETYLGCVRTREGEAARRPGVQGSGSGGNEAWVGWIGCRGWRAKRERGDDPFAFVADLGDVPADVTYPTGAPD